MADSTGAQTFCGDCGARVRSGAAFCTSCGESLSTPQQSGGDKAESPSEPSAVESQIIDDRPRQRWDSVKDRPAASTSGADEEQSGASAWGPVVASGGSGATQEFDYTDPVQSFITTIQSIVTGPVGFFSGMARQGDYINPLIFALVAVEIYAVVAGIVSILSAATGFGSVGSAFGTLLLLVILMPIVGAISLFIGAGIYHLMVMLIVKPADTGFETTFRVWAYSVTPGLLVAWIPILGPIVGAIWSYVLAALGVREAHSTTTGKAAAVVLIPVGVVGVISLILGLIIWALIAAALSSVGA